VEGQQSFIPLAVYWRYGDECIRLSGSYKTDAVEVAYLESLK